MNVSIGVLAYNEEQNIEIVINSLLKQKTFSVNIREIIIVSSGSNDKTNEIVEKISDKNKKVRLIKENKRRGKSHAINLFLKKAKSKILVLESADTIPSSTTIEKLCSKFKDSNIGIVGSRVIPKKNKNKIMNFTVQLQWILHHEISKDNPKFGELIAFRKIMKNIPLTAVDEEEIASVIKNKNFKTIYEPKAIVHNKGPETVKDFFRQRRRIYCGHLQLKKKMNYEASSLNTFKVLKKFIKLKQVRKNIFLSIIAVMLECFGRLLGLVDYYTNKNHVVWKVSESTKKLRWKF